MKRTNLIEIKAMKNGREGVSTPSSTWWLLEDLHDSGLAVPSTSNLGKVLAEWLELDREREPPLHEEVDRFAGLLTETGEAIVRDVPKLGTIAISWKDSITLFASGCPPFTSKESNPPDPLGIWLAASACWGWLARPG